MIGQMESVILLHGLWMPGLVMRPHEHWLLGEGFAARRFSYPSWRGGLAGNVRLLSRFVSETPGAVIHLVAHSLGGLVALMMLSQEFDERISRVVLLGTPYSASHCGSTLAALPMLRALVGRTFTDWFSLPRPALPAGVEIGVISGTRGIGLGRLIPGLARPNDGLVAVSETRIAGVSDSIELDVSHSGMLVSRACAVSVADFLRKGTFAHG